MTTKLPSDIQAKSHQLSYERKKSLYGYGFIAPWIIGALIFFIRPLIMVFQFAFSQINFTETGYSLEGVGLKCFKYALFTDPDYVRLLAASLRSMINNVPIIVISSLIVAVVLNQKFRGRTFFRAVFFLPVIVSSGIIISIFYGDSLAQSAMSGGSSSMLNVSDLSVILLNSGIPQSVSAFLAGAATNIFNLFWKSGIQILLFIAALQTISPSVYEASKIEGASSWDDFWKITLPMISPMIMLAVIYTIIDVFTDYNNIAMRKITNLATNLDISGAAAYSIIYFIMILAFISIVYVILKRFIFYSVD